MNAESAKRVAFKQLAEAVFFFLLSPQQNVQMLFLVFPASAHRRQTLAFTVKPNLFSPQMPSQRG